MLTEQQRDNRQNSIGGSDAGVIANCHPYKTARELYHEKRGDLPEEEFQSEAAEFGHKLEDVVAQTYSERTGNKVRRVSKTLVHPDLPWMRGHIDRDIVATDRALECKTSSAYLTKMWGEPGTDQVPEHYLLQCQHYMALLPKIEVFDLAVLVGGNQFKLFHIPRNNSLIDVLISIESEFWNRVQNEDPPEFDWAHQSTNELIDQLYPGTTGEVMNLPDQAYHWHQVLEDAKKQEKNYQSVIDAAKSHLKSLMGDAAVGLIGESGYTRKLVRRKAYSVEESTYIDFRFSKKPKGI